MRRPNFPVAAFAGRTSATFPQHDDRSSKGDTTPYSQEEVGSGAEVRYRIAQVQNESSAYSPTSNRGKDRSAPQALARPTRMAVLGRCGSVDPRNRGKGNARAIRAPASVAKCPRRLRAGDCIADCGSIFEPIQEDAVSWSMCARRMVDPRKTDWVQKWVHDWSQSCLLTLRSQTGVLDDPAVGRA